MKVLVLNGSPRGERSNTMQLTSAFLKGMQRGGDCEIEMVPVYQKNIKDCLGCFCCWTKTPGKCVISDDMGQILQAYLEADMIVWSFPLYYYGMPSRIKALMDRLLPTNLPFMAVSETGETCGHPSRYDMSGKRYALLSTCGFYTREHNYDALEKQFETLYGDNLLKILCPEGELFAQPQLKVRCNEYLKSVEAAGCEWMSKGAVSSKTKKKLDELLYPPEAFVEMADASWDIAEGADEACSGNGAGTAGEADAGTTAGAVDRPKSKAASLMRQMAAIYNPTVYGKDLVLEFYFTDLKETYQLAVKDGKCRMKTKNDGFEAYTTRIETPYDLWMDISMGKVNGAQAMMERKYRTLGDFNVMLSLDKMFGTASPDEEEQDDGRAVCPEKKTNMSVLILLWCALWVFLPIDPLLGAGIGILAVACIPLAGMKWELTPYEAISSLCVGALSLAALWQSGTSGMLSGGSSPDMTFLICLSYLLFGIMWTLSCLRPIPLTACYSKNEYGGNVAYQNPLFIRTNRILTLCWGVLYLLTPIWTYFLMQTGLSSYTGLFNSLSPALMGVFTAWFQKWYPAKVARG